VIRSQQILDILSKPFTAEARGRSMFLAGQSRSLANQVTPAQRKFFDELARVQIRPAETYVHPASGGLVHRKDGPLTPLEVAWLQRLPLDPAQVSFKDAQVLATMAISLAGDTESRRLLDSVWLPVKAIHDRAAAEVALRNAQSAQPAIPSAAGALADALAAEHPTLRENEAAARAFEELARAEKVRDAAIQSAIDKARASLGGIDAASAARLAPVR
jgi:hypothetical protein